jgi:hypothetical protein
MTLFSSGFPAARAAKALMTGSGPGLGLGVAAAGVGFGRALEADACVLGGGGGAVGMFEGAFGGGAWIGLGGGGV